MAEGGQAVHQGEHLATTTPPVSTPPRRRWRRRTVWLMVLLLGGLAGTAAWQRLGLQPVDEQAAPSPPPQAAEVVVLHEH